MMNEFLDRLHNAYKPIPSTVKGAELERELLYRIVLLYGATPCDFKPRIRRVFIP